MKDLLSGLLGSQDKNVKALEKRVNRILEYEDILSKLSDEELRGKTQMFKDRLKNGETLDNILEEAFAVVREAAFRVLGMKHFPVQLMGGMVLHEGNIAEMKTGEGKTLVATLPTYLNALEEKGVFVITANDYLAERDKSEMGAVHEFLGLTVGLISREMDTPEKKEAYACDVTYGTNSEFGFDYLRDNMAIVKEGICQAKRNYAIIDEVDSILIDEARTPLIMTGESSRASQYYITVDRFVKALVKEDYEKDNEAGTVHLTQLGMDKAEKIFGLENIADVKNTELIHHIRQSLSANYIMEKDQDYVVKEDKIVIVDKFTGRLLPGTRYNGGLHQAIEAKENVEIQKESKTMAMITYQNYFKLFDKISGMTGTAYTDKGEIKDTYGMDVVSIPTNKTMIRVDKPDMVFKTKEAKFKEVVAEIKRRNDKGQPVLLGTLYIDESEKISEMLTKVNVKHKLLNAKQNKDEAEIISMAGQMGAVTIATNMAGRGTDIKLGEGVAELGGLFVLGTEKHDSRRIDNQLRGRAGRQGDSGESQFFISLEDSLFKKINADAMERVVKIIEKLGLKDDEAIEDKLVSQAIEGIQKNVEIMSYNIRKSTNEFDTILNKQRETIYAERNKILNGEDMSSFIKDIIKDIISIEVDRCTSNSPYSEEWLLDELQAFIEDTLYLKDCINVRELIQEEEDADIDELKEKIVSLTINTYEEKEKILGEKQLRYIERLTLMKSIDEKWIDHLDVVEQIRQGVNFQYLGGNAPIRIFNIEAFNLFDEMLLEIKKLTLRSLLLLTGMNFGQKSEADIKEEEKSTRILDLEDKYHINRKHMLKLAPNTPKIAFNVDINATEEVQASYVLVYMDNGYEEILEGFEKNVHIDGIFMVEFDKPNEKDWQLGWHQIKILVSGNEAGVVNFLISDDVPEERKTEAADIQFYSIHCPNIRFQLNLEGYKHDKINGALLYERREDTFMPLEIPVVNENIEVVIPRPEGGWGKGRYEFILAHEKNDVVLPFMFVDEFNAQEEEVYAEFAFEIEEGQVGNMLGQLICIDDAEIIRELPISINKSGLVRILFRKEQEAWKSGRYEFRLIAFDKIILIKHFLISE